MATLLFDPKFESPFLLHELSVCLMNTLIVTLEILCEIVVRSGIRSRFIVCAPSEQLVKWDNFVFFSARRLIRRLELVDWGYLPT